jgi:hypothetical protein
MIRSSDCPIASGSLKPKMRAAPAFQNWIVSAASA